MLLAPVLAVLTKSPMGSLLPILFGLVIMSSQAVVHLITLPVEWDASFGRALPLLQAGGYIRDDQVPSVRRVLRAAALTYVAASLIGLLNVWRWLRLLRRG